MADSVAAKDVQTIILACEAGMGSSLMVVNQMKKKLKKAKVNGVKVVHKPARAVPADAKLVLVHKGLAGVIRERVPNAVVVSFKMFMNDPVFDQVVSAFVNGEEIASV